MDSNVCGFGFVLSVHHRLSCENYTGAGHPGEDDIGGLVLVSVLFVID